jgi:hypothetical protein
VSFYGNVLTLPEKEIADAEKEVKKTEVDVVKK